MLLFRICMPIPCFQAVSLSTPAISHPYPALTSTSPPTHPFHLASLTSSSLPVSAHPQYRPFSLQHFSPLLTSLQRIASFRSLSTALPFTQPFQMQRSWDITAVHTGASLNCKLAGVPACFLDRFLGHLPARSKQASPMRSK